MQKLMLPINKALITVGYKNPWYPKNMKGLIHYGVDMVHENGKKYLYGCGDGEVIACGYDNVLGNVLAILYRDCKLTDRDDHVVDVIVRYFHLHQVLVKPGDKVNRWVKMAYYGNTGKYTSGAHLHVECDLDCDYPLHTPSLSKHSNVFKASPKGHDSTINPIYVFHVEQDEPECQTVKRKYYDSTLVSDTKYLNR